MKKVSLYIQDQASRDEIILSLANSGYTVTTKSLIDHSNICGKKHLVIFEVEDFNIIDDEILLKKIAEEKQ